MAPTAISGDVDLLVVGSPNHGWSMPRPGTRQDAATKTDAPLVSPGDRRPGMAGHRHGGPNGAHGRVRHQGFASQGRVVFDHASTQIEKALATLGGFPAAPAEHFRVAGMTGPLEPGELDRARAWGRTLAALV